MGKRNQSEHIKKLGKIKQRLDNYENNTKKRLDNLCKALQVMGWIIYIVAIVYDGIASCFTLQHAYGVSWWQSALALYGIALVFIGEKAK